VAGTGNLLIFGASARAAAFSALRAGITPWCVDLFADADLEARCTVRRLPPSKYPHGFVEAAGRGPKGPWIFTSGLENRSGLVRQISKRHTYWGIGPDQVDGVRSPQALSWLFRKSGIPHPAFWYKHRCDVPPGKWLVKPWKASGGRDIRHWAGRRPPRALLQTHYFQEFIVGKPCAAIYLGGGRPIRLLGVTRQLIGESWLHAKSFQYCGSVGPLHLGPALREAFERLGTALTAERIRLRGLFGIDCVLRGNVPWPLEVNPRYTASIEVLEFGANVPAMALHRAVFDPDATAIQEKPRATASGVVGKAILFAQAALIFPTDGPWATTLRSQAPVGRMPDFADIPHAGERIEKGRPILSFFVRADSESACLGKLRAVARHLDRWLFER
jgi:predicted ATP-grasp superfamily ATP-dependent carboligase